MPYINRKAISDSFNPQVMEHIMAWNAAHNLTKSHVSVAPRQMDMLAGTDYIVWAGDRVLVSARVRTEDFKRYFDQDFTLRENTGTGRKTELAKFLDGELPSYYAVFLAEKDCITSGKLLDMDFLLNRLRSDESLLGKVLTTSTATRENPNQTFVTVCYADHPGLVIDQF